MTSPLLGEFQKGSRPNGRSAPQNAVRSAHKIQLRTDAYVRDDPATAPSAPITWARPGRGQNGESSN